MNITLFDRNADICNEWQEQFKNSEGVTIKHCDIKELTNIECLVTAGNSYGIMTGGIDKTVRNIFGLPLQDAIQDYILKYDIIPVGQSLLIHLADDVEYLNQFRQVLYTPTMKRPQKAHKLDIFYAATSIFYTAIQNDIKSIAIPGLGTGIGELDPKEFAHIFKIAYNNSWSI